MMPRHPLEKIMTLYDTLNQLKTKVHCSEMTAETALDTLYQFAVSLIHHIQVPEQSPMPDRTEPEPAVDAGVPEPTETPPADAPAKKGKSK
jgi:hypothetical protein